MHHEIERIPTYNGERPGPNLFFQEEPGAGLSTYPKNFTE